MNKNKPTEQKGDFAFTSENYKVMIIGVVLIAIGFLLLIGGGSKDPKVFSTALFSTRRLFVSPIVLVAGYVTVFFSIIKKPKKKEEQQQQ